MSETKRCKTPTYVVQIKMSASVIDARFIDGKMYQANRRYNSLVKYMRRRIDGVFANNNYICMLGQYKEGKISCKEIFSWLTDRGISNNAMKIWLTKGNKAYAGLNSQCSQELADECWAGVKKCLFDQDKTLHFRKFGQTNVLTSPQASRAIIYDPSTHTVRFMGRRILLKPLRKNDIYIAECMMDRIKFCSVKRVNSKASGYEYYLQLHMEGVPPKKYEIGSGTEGVDYGTSTIASYSGKELSFEEVAPDVKEYNRRIKLESAEYERATRRANPDCYDKDGKAIKGSKCKNWTAARRKALMKLKFTYHRKSVYVKLWWRHHNNEVLKRSNLIISEEMNWRGLARKAKDTARQDRKSSVKKKDGSIIEVHKFKRRKRFGKSVLDRSPGFGEADMKRKIESQGGSYVKVNTRVYRASQYHHDTGEYVKPKLSERTKQIGGHTVSRDTYSAFLLYHMGDAEHVNTEACTLDFDHYLKLQGSLVARIRKQGNVTQNFGLSEF